MKILFLVYHGFSDSSGISKKIHYQVKGLRENGYDVHLCYYDFSSEGHRCRFIDGNILKDYGKGRLAAMRQRIDYQCIYNYCLNEGVNFVYARSFHNANPFLVRFFRKLRQHGIMAVTEIPTYPYDSEYNKEYGWSVRLGIWINKRYRQQLAQAMKAIVTFSDEKIIFGQRTINISNGVDMDSTPLHAPFPASPGKPLHLIGVAEVHYWHGFDRLIAGLGEYYQQQKDKPGRDVFFHIVGDVGASAMHGNSCQVGFQTLIDRYGLQDRVIFHGSLYGQSLDQVFDECQFAIGSLGRHRSGITSIKTLKNREYATRGIPFIYSEQDSDFDQQPYILKAAPDNSPVSIQRIIDFVDSKVWNPEEIRHSVEHLSWKTQMQKVVEQAFNA